jgi:hypothetical protein
LAAVLARTAEAAAFGEQAVSDLHKKISADLEKARFRYKVPYRHAYEPLLPDKSFDVALSSNFDLDHYGADAVWRYCVAIREGLEQVSQYLVGRAWQEYLQRADAYDFILGDLVPPDFRKRARGHLAQLDYDRGANATAAADWAVYRQRLRDRRRQHLPGLSTGLPRLDAALGGLRGLTVLAGRAGDGKTALALAMAVAALHTHPDAAVLFYSLDMGKDVLFDRLLCHEAGVGYDLLLRKYRPADVQPALDDAAKRLLEGVLPRLQFIERQRTLAEGGLTTGHLWEHRNQLLRATGADRALVVVDFFGKIDVGASDLGPLEQDHRRLGLLTDALELSRRGSPPGDSYVLISEVRKERSGGDSLCLDDLLGSCRLGYSADAVLLLERDGSAARARDTTPLVLKVEKARDGTTRCRVPLTFDFTRYRFRERAATPAGAGAAADRQAPDGQHAPRPGGGVDPLAVGRKE